MMKKGSWGWGILGSLVFYIIWVIFLWLASGLISIGRRFDLLKILTLSLSNESRFITLSIIVTGFLTGFLIKTLKDKRKNDK